MATPEEQEQNRAVKFALLEKRVQDLEEAKKKAETVNKLIIGAVIAVLIPRIIEVLSAGGL